MLFILSESETVEEETELLHVHTQSPQRKPVWFPDFIHNHWEFNDFSDNQINNNQSAWDKSRHVLCICLRFVIKKKITYH